MSIKERINDAVLALSGVRPTTGAVGQQQQTTAQGNQKDAQGTAAFPDFGDAPSRIDAVKSTYIEWTALTVPFALAILLAVSNGYFFSGFKDFTLTDTSVVIAWGSGFAIEAAALAAIFHAAQRLKSGKRKDFLVSLTWALILASVSFLAQYVYLQMMVVRGALQVNDAAIDKMPLFSILVGVNGFQGHDILFLVRTSAYHIAEIACTFLFTSKGTSIEAAIRREQEKFTYRTMMETQQTVLQLMTNVRAKEKRDLTQTAAEILVGTSITQEPVVRDLVPAPTPMTPQQQQAPQFNIDMKALAEALSHYMPSAPPPPIEDTGETQKMPPVHPLQPLLNARKLEAKQ